MEFKELRRVVTGVDASGKSYVAIDGPPAEVIGSARSGLGEIWVTDGAPADNATSGDAAKRPIKLEPPPNGSIFRFFQVAPENKAISAKEFEEGVAGSFAAIGASHCRVDTSRHPAMHTTRTVDYIALLSGKVTLLLDDGEVDLKPFDVVVQRGTNHSWINRGPDPALLVGVLIDAKPLKRR